MLLFFIMDQLLRCKHPMVKPNSGAIAHNITDNLSQKSTPLFKQAHFMLLKAHHILIIVQEKQLNR